MHYQIFIDNNNNNYNTNNDDDDVRVGEKEREKVEKYQDLKREIGRFWKLKMVEVFYKLSATQGVRITLTVTPTCKVHMVLL